MAREENNATIKIQEVKIAMSGTNEYVGGIPAPIPGIVHSVVGFPFPTNLGENSKYNLAKPVIPLKETPLPCFRSISLQAVMTACFSLPNVSQFG